MRGPANTIEKPFLTTGSFACLSDQHIPQESVAIAEQCLVPTAFFQVNPSVHLYTGT